VVVVGHVVGQISDHGLGRHRVREGRAVDLDAAYLRAVVQTPRLGVAGAVHQVRDVVAHLLDAEDEAGRRGGDVLFLDLDVKVRAVRGPAPQQGLVVAGIVAGIERDADIAAESVRRHAEGHVPDHGPVVRVRRIPVGAGVGAGHDLDSLPRAQRQLRRIGVVNRLDVETVGEPRALRRVPVADLGVDEVADEGFVVLKLRDVAGALHQLRPRLAVHDAGFLHAAFPQQVTVHVAYLDGRQHGRVVAREPGRRDHVQRAAHEPALAVDLPRRVQHVDAVAADDLRRVAARPVERLLAAR